MKVLSAGQWEATTSLLPMHSFFITPLWGRILDDSRLGYRCLALTADLGEVEVFVPVAESRRYGFVLRESMPFGTYGGPLITEAAKGADLERAARELARMVVAERLVGVFQATPGPHPHLRLSIPTATYEADVLDLSVGRQALWDGLHSNARSPVRQAERAGVEVRVDNSEKGFRDYFSMLEASSRRWGMSDPSKPWSLFESISRHADTHSVRLWLADVEGRPAAGALCFYGAGEVFWWTGAMHEELSQHRPNNLIQWRIIEDAVERGFTTYNMGSSGELAGVHRFKQQFGARPRPYPTYLIRGPLWSAARGLVRLPRRLLARA